MAKKIKAKPIVVQSSTFDSIIAEMKERADAEELRIAARSPAERAAWEARKAAQDAKIEKLLKELRGPGFMQFNVPLK